MLKTRKLISMLLVVAMVVSMLAIGIIAAHADDSAYYLIGTMTSWGDNGLPGAELRFTRTENAAFEEYVLENYTLSTSDLFKAVKSNKDDTVIASWVPDGMDNNVSVDQAGVYNIYFAPNGDGNADSWIYIPFNGDGTGMETHGCNHGGYMFYLELVEEVEEPTGEPTEAGDPYVPESTITVYFTNNNGWTDVKCYYWGTEGDPQWPGVDATFDHTNDLEQDIYSAEIDATATGVIFSGNGGQTVDITEGIADGAGWYLTGEQDVQEHYEVALWPTEDPDPNPTEAPDPSEDATDEAPATQPASGETSVTVDGVKVTAHVGDIIHFESYLDMSGVPAQGGYPGKVRAIEGSVYFDNDKLKLVSDLSEMDDNDIFYTAVPNIVGVILSNDEPGRVGYNASKVQAGHPEAGFDFSSKKLLIKLDFEVIADGESEINSIIQNLGSGDVKVVYQSEIKEPFGFENKFTVECTHAQPTTPSEDVTTPSEDVTTPSEDVTTPSEDATTPSEDTTTPAQPGVSKITVIDVLGNTSETKVVEVGDVITVTAYLCVPDGKRVNSINVWQEFNIGADMVEVIDKVDDMDDDGVYLLIAPNLKGGPTANIEGNVVKVNASAAKYKPSSKFSKADTGNDETVLLQIRYRVIAPGESTIKTNIVTMATIEDAENDPMTNQIMHSEKVGDDELSARTTLDAPEHEIPTTPSEDVTTPSEDVTTPSEDVTTPSEDVTTPSEDVTTPSEDVTTPSEDVTEPLEKGVYVKADGTTYKVEKGQIFNYVYYLNTGEKVCSLDAETFFDTDGLVLKSGTESEDDLTALFPVIKDSMTLNANVEGRLKYNYSHQTGKDFNTDEKVLINAQFEVTADEGLYEINTFLHTVAGANEHKYIFKDDVLEDLQKAETVLKDVDGNDMEEYTGPVVVDSEYAFTEKVDEWTLGTAGTANFTVKDIKGDDSQTFGKFRGVEIDTDVLDAAAYTAEAGSVKIAISADVMNALTEGEHTLCVFFEDDEVETTFNVVKAAVVPSEDETTPSEDETTPAEDETEAPTDEETEAPTQKSTVTSPTSPKSTTTQTKTTTNTSTVKTGSTEMAIIFLMVLVMAAGVVLYTKKRKFD